MSEWQTESDAEERGPSVAFIEEIDDDEAGVIVAAGAVSADDEDEILQESLWDRIAALSDAVPLAQRQSVTRFSRRAYRSAAGVLSWLGSSAWVVGTAAMMVVLPVALELEKEQAAIAQENQVRLQQQIAQNPPALGGAAA